MKLAISLYPYQDNTTKTIYAPTTPEELMSVFRTMRNMLLTECDWCVLPDAPLSASVVEEWKQWRQVMRDLPASLVFVSEQKWVEIPEPPVVGKLLSWQNVDYDFISVEGLTDHSHDSDSI
jgi:hypothetical protein